MFTTYEICKSNHLATRGVHTDTLWEERALA